jgi:hypothetical protein
LAVLEEAPTTAKCLDEKKVLMEASVLMVGEGMVMGGGRQLVGRNRVLGVDYTTKMTDVASCPAFTVVDEPHLQVHMSRVPAGRPHVFTGSGAVSSCSHVITR